MRELRLGSAFVAGVLVAAVTFGAGPVELQYGSVKVSRGARPDTAAQAEPEGKWWNDAVFYQIFPRSFADSDGDGVGDFRGMLTHLDDLKSVSEGEPASLGVNAIWLTPVFDSPSYHGYDTRDFYKTQAQFGTITEFRDLLAGCKRRGIRVILDLMLNHSSSEHPWFVESAKSPKSPKRDWYVWREKDPGWKRPWDEKSSVWYPFGNYFYYALFGRGMPDLNLTNEAVYRELVEVARFWLSLGVSGFRLDAVKHLIEKDGELANRPETHAFLRRYTAELRKEFPEVVFVGEVWDSPDKVAPYFGRGDELDLAFGFNVSSGILEAARERRSQPFVKALEDDLKFLPAQRFNAPFLANHDMDRVGKILGSQTEALKLAASALLSLPGTPFIYFGEELGVSNSSASGDDGRRAIMLWNSDCSAGAGFSPKGTHWTSLPPCGSTGRNGAVDGVREQKMRADSLWNHYRQLISIRQAHEGLRSGLLTNVSANDGLVLLERAAKGEVVVVALNFGRDESAVAKVSLAPKTLSRAGLVADKLPAPKQIYPRSSTCFMAAAQRLDCMWDGRRLTINPIPPGGSVWVRIGSTHEPR